LEHQGFFGWLLVVAAIVILLSPLVYWLTGIGQSASQLSADITYAPDGTLVSSPKAVALHDLTLPMGIERLLIYPLVLIGFQLSGESLALRRWVERLAQGQPLRGVQGQPRLARRNLGRLLGHMGRLIPRAWRGRVTGQDLAVALLFIVMLEVATSLLYLPFSFYGSFIVARQFGYSTQTAPAWLWDWIKNLSITLVADGVIWTGFYALLRLMPRRWPIPAGGALIGLSAVVILITPILITPLFYKIHPLQDAALRARILALADRAGLHVSQVYVIDESSKSTLVNAYFTGFGNSRRIVLYDNLLTGYTPDEVEVVLAHEMGHWYYRHMLLGWLGAGAAGWIGLFGLRWLLNRSWARLGLRGPADVAGLPYILAVISFVAILALPVENSLSRYAERQADHFSLAVSHKPAAFIQLFQKFAVQNLSVVDVPEWEEIVFDTHPPIVDRIRMAETFREQEQK
jgi:STE24 endopeptidase